MIVWYDMALHLAWSPSSTPAWSPSCLRRQVHGATMKSYMLVIMKVTCLNVIIISHHTPRCKTKLDASTFYPFASFTWLLGLLKIRTVSYLRTLNHNILSIIISMIPSRRPSLALPCPLKLEKLTPVEPHLYGTSRISGVEPVSRKSTRKFGRGQLIIQQYRG